MRFVGTFQQSRQLGVVQLLGDAVGAHRLFAGDEVRPVPGGVAGTVSELAEGRGLEHRIRGAMPVVREQRDGGTFQPGGGRRRIRQQREAGQFADAVQHRHAEFGIPAGDGDAVVEQHLAQPHQGVVHLGQLRRLGLLVAADRADQVASQRPGRHRDARQARRRRAVARCRSREERRGPTTSTRLFAATRAPRALTMVWVPPVPGSVFTTTEFPAAIWATTFSCSASASSSRVSSSGERWSSGRHVDRGVALFDGPFRGGVAGQRVEHRMVQVRRIRPHRGADIGERRDHEARGHVEPFEVHGEAAEPVDDGIGFERSVLLGECGEGVGVQPDAELFVQHARQFRVQVGVAQQPHLEVAAVAADRERSQQDRRAVVGSLELPLRHADAEVDGVDAAHGGQFQALRGDLARGQLRGAQGQVVPDQAATATSSCR